MNAELRDLLSPDKGGLGWGGGGSSPRYGMQTHVYDRYRVASTIEPLPPFPPVVLSF